MSTVAPFDSSQHLRFGARDVQMLHQDQAGSGNSWECRNMDIVSACRGTSVSEMYRGNFEVYEGPCRGSFVEGLPMYRSTDRPHQPLYIYPIDYYPDNWSFAPLRGLVRWRIASFETFDDKTSCRTESANIFQLEFAANGHPYDYYPTIYCFDANGNDLSGYQTSSINIRCNDGFTTEEVSNVNALPPPTSAATSADGTYREHAGAIIVSLGALMIAIVAMLFLWNRRKERRQSYSFSGPGDSGKPTAPFQSSRHPHPTTKGGVFYHQQPQQPHRKNRSTHSQLFQDEPEDDDDDDVDCEQPSFASSSSLRQSSSHHDGSSGGMFTFRNIRSQLNESTHALREEVKDLWNSLHSTTTTKTSITSN